MSTKNNKRKLDAYRPTFDPGLDIATVVFSHVQCVKTRVNLALVSKLWRDASKPAAAYPLVFDFIRDCPLAHVARLGVLPLHLFHLVPVMNGDGPEAFDPFLVPHDGGY
tara:strand:- start:800 stop:1126 length:327 start_codon:yes stop_codon:yes gene_type:complete